MKGARAKAPQKSAVFRIRKRYFGDVVSGEKNVEYRKDSLFWLRRFICDEPPEIAVFICGKQVHRRKISNIEYIKRPTDFSEQGQKDVPTPFCFAIHLGEVLK